MLYEGISRPRRIALLSVLGLLALISFGMYRVLALVSPIFIDVVIIFPRFRSRPPYRYQGIQLLPGGRCRCHLSQSRHLHPNYFSNSIF